MLVKEYKSSSCTVQKPRREERQGEHTLPVLGTSQPREAKPTSINSMAKVLGGVHGGPVSLVLGEDQRRIQHNNNSTGGSKMTTRMVIKFRELMREVDEHLTKAEMDEIVLVVMKALDRLEKEVAK